MLFRKKPVVIEARQNTSSWSVLGIARWIEGYGGTASINGSGGTSLSIHTLEGLMQCDPGDWVIQGVHNEFYPCKPDIFEKTYEPVEEPFSE
jgi:hypothetical protein